MQEERKSEKLEERETPFQAPYQKKYDNVKKLIHSAFAQLEKVQNVVESMEQEDKKNYYQNIPGTEGYFDGQYLVADDGRKTEVPANYAAKSRLVYGDRLKVFADTGKQVFKQITKAERKKIEGVLNKKEGKWVLLATEGTYKIADIAAEFNNAQLNDKASAYIPLGNPNVPFAALDRVLKSGVAEQANIVRPERKPVVAKEVEKKVAVKPRAKAPARKPIRAKKVEEPKEIKETPKKEFVADLMEEDDLR